MFGVEAQKVNTSPLNYFYFVFSNQRMMEHDAFQKIYNSENVNNISKIM